MRVPARKPGITAARNDLPAQRGYEYRGIPGWRPENVKVRTSDFDGGRGAELSAAGRRKRLADFTRLREEGKSVEEAGAAVGVKRTAAGGYERQRLAGGGT